MELKKVVLRYLDGTVIPGYAPLFEDGLATIPAVDLNGLPMDVPLASLKAVFFVRTYSGNPDYDPIRSPEELAALGQGPALRLAFKDGEVLLGEISGGTETSHGFFITVLDPDDNNLLVYVNPGALANPPAPASD